MTFLHSLPSEGSEITAHGQLLHRNAQMALAEVYVRDAHDRLAAHGTSRCSVFPPIDQSVQLVPPDDAAAAIEPGTPDPYVREPPAVDHNPPRRARDGLGLLRGQLRGEMCRPPIDQLTGIRLVGAEHGRVVFTLPANPLAAQRVGQRIRRDSHVTGKVGRGSGSAVDCYPWNQLYRTGRQDQLPARGSRRWSRTARQRHGAAPRQAAGDRHGRGDARR